MKKATVLFLVLLLAISFTGCAKDEKNSNESDISYYTSSENTFSSELTNVSSNNSSSDVSSSNTASTVSSTVQSKTSSTSLSYTPKVASNVSSKKTAEVSTVKPASSTVRETSASVLAGELNSWNLLLVNGNSPLPENYSITPAKIQPAYVRDAGMSFDSRAVSYLNSMCAAAKADGVKLLVISCYRAHSKQQSLFNAELAKVKSNNPGMSEKDAIKKASTVVAYPGTSEHEVGLAVDFNSVEETFENTAQFRWLKAHAAEYGFVNRYPKSKESITGVIYEPWHYRYVGINHAYKMNELGYCLEEYREYLKNQTK